MRRLLAVGLVIIGCALTVVGVALVYPPLGFLVAGGWLVAAGAFGFDVEG